MALDPFSQTIHPDRQTTGFDAGLRAYMLKIYNYMAMALVMTGAIAFFSAQSEAFLNAMYTIQDVTIVGTKPLAWVVMLAPLGLVIFLSFSLQRMSLAAVQICYWLYAALVGLSLSVIFLTFTGESIARVFFITAGTFGGMSLYGYSTRRNLAPLGWFLIMGLIGLIIASLVNLFLHSSGLQFALSIIGVLIFVGLTAYDTQKLKALYYQSAADSEWAGKLVIMGALTLYLDFINIFLNLLNLFGERKR
jgi:FtsH-binding integral membrane protein